MATLLVEKLQIWASFGMTCVDTKFDQGLQQVEKCRRLYGVCVTFMSTGHMYHEYDLCTDDFDINRTAPVDMNIRTGVCVSQVSD